MFYFGHPGTHLQQNTAGLGAMVGAADGVTMSTDSTVAAAGMGAAVGGAAEASATIEEEAGIQHESETVNTFKSSRLILANAAEMVSWVANNYI